LPAERRSTRRADGPAGVGGTGHP